MDKEVTKVKWELEIQCNFEDMPALQGFWSEKEIDKQASIVDSRQICK